MTTTFFGEPQLKAAVRHRVAEHQRLDQIAQRFYWADGSGCFIGCSLHSGKHSDFERLLGLPRWFAHLGEFIFEGLCPDRAVDFPLAVYDALPVGVPWERFSREVRSRFMLWLIVDERHGVVRWNDDPRVLAVGTLLARSCAADEPTPEEWAAAWAAALAASRTAGAAGVAALDAARTAALAAARAAPLAAAWAAALAASRTAALDAALAASRTAGAAGAAALAACAAAQRDELLRLLRACKPDAAAVPALPADEMFRTYYDRVRLEAGAASLVYDPTLACRRT